MKSEAKKDKQQVRVSVIIPVYNTQEYLRECVDSVLTQNYEDMEILLIDDASNDGCGRICEDYADRYAQIKTVHIDHCGVGRARNEGLRIAKGEYIIFADSDDYFSSENSIQRMIELLDTTHADVAVGNYCRLWDGRVLEATKHTVFSMKDQEDAYFRFSGFFTVGTLSYVWGKAYRHSFLKKNGIHFGSYEYAEDKFFNFQCFIEQAQYAFLDDVVYIYRKNNASISHQYQKDHIQCWLQLSTDLMQKLKTKNSYEKYGDLVAFTVNFAAFFDGKAAYCNTGKQIKAIKDVLKRYLACPVAYQCFCQLSQWRFIEKSFETRWKIMMWGFALCMRMKALSVLALGIKLLTDLRIYERLSDTGIKQK